MTITTVVGSINNLLEQYMDTAQAITEQLAAGDISLGQWHQQMRTIIKQSRATAIYHGRAGRSMNIFERVGASVRNFVDTQFQFNRLRGFVNELSAGNWDDPASLGRVLARARMYANSARETYNKEELAALADQGWTEKRRVLGAAEHCPDCVAQADLGWVPMNDPSVTFPGDGTTQCRSNCRCTLEYR